MTQTQTKQYSYRVSDAEQTRELGEQLAHHLRAGDLIMLRGGLGAGKTTFTKGLARGLEITEEITSPTFTISKVYENSHGQKLVHYDFYRLENPGIMVEDLFENLQDPRTVTVIEWADTVSEILPANHLRLEILINDDGSRTLNLTKNLTSEH